MPTLVTFNGSRYLLSSIRTHAASAPPISIKRDQVMLVDADVDHEMFPGLATLSIDQNDVATASSTGVAERLLIVCIYGGKYYFLQGAELAKTQFEQTDTVKARFLSKPALKKCLLGYVGAKIVVEEPEPRFQSRGYGDRSRSYDAPRTTYNRNSRDR
jgi:hypothetical protein